MANLPRTNEQIRELSLFAGSGGGILASRMLGIRTVCAVELDSYASSVLVARQNDGELEPFPIWDDVQTFDGNPWQGIIDIVSGGFPCTDISCAGQRAGIDGEQSGLWKEMARIISEVRPSYAFIENAADLPIRGLDRILCDLASMGFDAVWGNMAASAVGAPHERKRTWILAANTNGKRQQQPCRTIKKIGERIADNPKTAAYALRYGLERAIQQGRLRQADADAIQAAAGYTSARGWLPVESGVCGVVHGLAIRLDDAA